MRHIGAFFFALSLGLAGQAFAAAGDAWFLTADEFARLTPREQKQYVREVQGALGGLAERSEYFASVPTQKRTIAQEAPEFTAEQVERAYQQAANWRGEERADFQYHHPARADQFREQSENSMWWVVFSRLAVNGLPESDPKRAGLVKKIDELEKYYLSKRDTFKKSFDKSGSLDGAFTAIEKARDGKIKPDDEIFPKPLINYKDKQPIRPTAVRGPQTANGPTNVATAPIVAPVAPPAVAPVTAPPPAAIEPPKQQPLAPAPPPPAPTVNSPNQQPATPREPVLMGYRCMYAGFIVKGDPCRGPNTLPSDTWLKGLNADNFKCGDQVLCNPLLFGVKKTCELKASTSDADARKCLGESKAVCVPRGKYATRNCAVAGGSDESLDSVLALLKANPEAWQEYLTSFYELCDDDMQVFNGFVTSKDGKKRELPEKTRIDIEQTCNHAKARLKEISDKYRSVDISKRPERKQNDAAPTTKGKQ